MEADWYSVGATVVEALTGRYTRIMSPEDIVKRLDRVNIPASLDAQLKQWLDRDPKQRTQPPSINVVTPIHETKWRNRLATWTAVGGMVGDVGIGAGWVATYIVFLHEPLKDPSIWTLGGPILGGTLAGALTGRYLAKRKNAKEREELERQKNKQEALVLQNLRRPSIPQDPITSGRKKGLRDLMQGFKDGLKIGFWPFT